MSEQVVIIEDNVQAITVRDIKEEVFNEEDVQIMDVKDIKEEEEEEEEEDIFDMLTPQESVISEVESHCKDRHKQVECQVCLRKMRSNNLKRHMRKHRELHILDEDEIKHRKKLLETKEDRKKLVKQIAVEEGLQPEHYDIEILDILNPISVEKQLMDGDLIYKRKIELGKIITTVLEKGNVQEDSLSKDYREVLKIYRKQMSRRNLSNVKLRPWQQQLMNNISTPSDREVIWITGKKGNEDKTWFQEYI